MRVERLALLAAVLFGLVASTGCMQMTPNSDSNGGGSNDGGNGSTNGDSSDGSTSNNGMAKLTISVTGPDMGGFARVVGSTNDGAKVHADFADGVPEILVRYSPDFGTLTSELEFEVGTQVALVAIESDGFLTSSQPQLPLDSPPLQFDRWEGDFTNGDMGANEATLFFTLDGDRSIEAIFTEMAPVFIMQEEGQPQSNMLITIVGEPFVVFPPPATGAAGISNPAGPVVLWGAQRDGIVVELEINDGIDNDSAACENSTDIVQCNVFVEWTGDCDGSGKTCELTFGEASEATAVFENIAVN